MELRVAPRALVERSLGGEIGACAARLADGDDRMTSNAEYGDAARPRRPRDEGPRVSRDQGLNKRLRSFVRSHAIVLIDPFAVLRARDRRRRSSSTPSSQRPLAPGRRVSGGRTPRGRSKSRMPAPWCSPRILGNQHAARRAACGSSVETARSQPSTALSRSWCITDVAARGHHPLSGHAERDRATPRTTSPVDLWPTSARDGRGRRARRRCRHARADAPRTERADGSVVAAARA